jgi:hypothetical protein
MITFQISSVSFVKAHDRDTARKLLDDAMYDMMQTNPDMFMGYNVFYDDWRDGDGLEEIYV